MKPINKNLDQIITNNIAVPEIIKPALSKLNNSVASGLFGYGRSK